MPGLSILQENILQSFSESVMRCLNTEMDHGFRLQKVKLFSNPLWTSLKYLK